MTNQPSFAIHASIDSEIRPLALWDIAENDFPRDGSQMEKWKFFLRYAVLAPSSHNTQPWLFHILGNQLNLYADRTRACRTVDPDDRELVMSCSCALLHLRCAMAHFGHWGGAEILPDPNDPDLLAVVQLGTLQETSLEESALFHAITKRRTNRQPFSDDPVPPMLLSSLRQAVGEEFAWMEIITGEEQRHVAASLIAEGDRRQWANKRFRLELAAWVHPNRSSARDGIPGYAQGMDDLLSFTGPLVVRTFNMGDGQAAKDHELAKGSPALAVIGTDEDSPRDWMHAGQALARTLLQARVEGVWASFLNQAIEVPDLRLQFCSSLGLKGFPQVCLRLGFGSEIKPTPRRSPDEVII